MPIYFLGHVAHGSASRKGTHTKEMIRLPGLTYDGTKMLILGTVFRCLGPVLTIAACLSSKPLFVSPMDKREEANQ